MRGLSLVLPMIALIGLAACEEQTVTLTLGGGGTDGQLAGFRQTECLEFQRRMEDMSLPVFVRNGARQDFNSRNCVYRSQSVGTGPLAPAETVVATPAG